MKKDFFVIIAAAGLSTRMNGTNKLLININTKPLIIYTLEKFKNFNIILACNDNNIKKMKYLLKKYQINTFKLISGDDSRSKTIYKALLHVPENIKNVIIHDGARPCVSARLIKTLINTFKTNKYLSIMPILKINDSIKINNNGKFQNINRDKFFSVQTPQIFNKNILKEAFDKTINNKNLFFYDETSLLEYIGYHTNAICGDIFNIKITTKNDIKLIKKYLETKK